MLKITVRGLLAHKLRFAMTAAAVVIGVSFIAGTFILTDSINASFKGIFIQPAVGRDTTVRSRSAFGSTGVVAVDVQRAPVPDRLIAAIERVPGVKVAAGTVQGYAQLVGKDGKAVRAENASLLGTNWLAERELSVTSLDVGHGPVGGDQIAIDARTFKHGGFHLGDRATVLSAHAPRRFTIVASLTFGGADSPGGATVVAFDGPTAQAMVGQPGMWDEIEVAGLRPGISAGVLTQRIGNALPVSYEAATSASVAAALAKSVQGALGHLSVVLMVFVGVAVFAGMFIVYNTFSMLVAQRSRELALLRALGASRRQVGWSVLAEAAVVGTVASGLGLGLGALAAVGLERVFVATGFGLPASRLTVASRTVLVSLAAGFAITIASSIIPARRASRLPPVAAMTAADLCEPLSPVRTSIVGLAACVSGQVLLFAGLLAHPAKAVVVGAGAMLTFTGMVTLSPQAIVPLARVVGAPVRIWGGIAGRLSQENAMRSPRRTAATAAALMIGVALVTIIATLGATMKATLARALHDSLQADYVVSTTSGSFLSGATLDGFSSDLAASLRSQPEVAQVAEVRGGYWHRGASLVYLSAIDPANRAPGHQLPPVVGVDGEHVPGPGADRRLAGQTPAPGGGRPSDHGIRRHRAAGPGGRRDLQTQ